MKKKIFALILAIVTVISVFSMTTMSAYALIYEYPNSNPIQSGQPTFPLKDFPSGTSYFNDFHFKGKNQKCNHHGNGSCKYNVKNSCDCTNYASSIQCAAFAKYAYDQYSHRTSWYSDSDVDTTKDKHNGGSFSTDTGLRNIMKQITPNSYVRLLKIGSNTDGHSFILISCNETTVTMYDANYKGECKVALHTEKYSDLIGIYNKVEAWYAHNYSYSKYSSSQHKATCKTSGCGGYIYEAHSFTYTKNNSSTHTATCSKCGYSTSQSHSMTKYTNKSTAKHAVVCSICGYSKTESHSLKYTSNNGSTHKVACSKCSYSATKSHSFTYTKRNNTTHTVSCSTCGYSGTQKHFAESPGTNVECLGCGYVGNISEGRLSVEDEIASFDDIDS